jgi:hypothetical protein
VWHSQHHRQQNGNNGHDTPHSERDVIPRSGFVSRNLLANTNYLIYGTINKKAINKIANHYELFVEK